MLKEILAGFPAEKKIHLRHLIQVGISMEEKGKAFYDSFAGRALDQDVKKVSLWLAGQELLHKQFLEDMVSQWLPIPVDKGRIAVIENELKVRGIFVKPPSADFTEKEFIEYAISTENKMVEFYLFFEEKFTAVWKQMNIHKIVGEERNHAAQLKALLDR